MKILAKMATIAAAVAMTSQPCLAAAVESPSESVAATKAGSAAKPVHFNLKPHGSDASGRVQYAESNGLGAASTASASVSLAASQQTASEGEEPPKRRGPGSTTWLIVGGAALLVVLAVVVASASPAPGPSEGDFE